MVGATNQRTATTAVARAGSITVAAGVCAVVGQYRHLRCAPGVCLILECKITKVVERPGVHYRGRHSPWISGYLVGSSFVRRLLYEINTRTELMTGAI